MGEHVNTPYGLTTTASLPPWQPDPSAARITRVRSILTAPEGVTLVVVKVETNVDGLYGLGCATFTQRAAAVATVVDEYLAPALVGRDPADITDIFHGMHVDSYWRNSVVLNSALSGVDMALWDINGKQAQMPVWQLLGGRARARVATYVHAFGRDADELADDVHRLIGEGYRYVRCQVSVPGSLTYGAKSDPSHTTWDSGTYVRLVPRVFERLRAAVGDEVELLHDVHERVSPAQAVTLTKALEPFHLYFLEDPLAPEDLDWLDRLRAVTTTPIAIGELFSHPAEYLPLIRGNRIDFIRCHLSAIGGITPGWRLASTCELFGVQTAWHGPRDVSPIGHAANLALDVASPNFGVQEIHRFGDAVQELFPGTPTVTDGHLTPSNAPGLGIDLDERLVAKYPPLPTMSNWQHARVRRPDGAVQRP